jgi:cytidylate kinase
VPFLDRAIPLAVANRLEVPFDDAAALDEHAGTGWLERILTGFAGGDAVPTPLSGDAFSSHDFLRATEQVLREQAATGEGVILGRGGVVLLRHDPRALRVRLDGPPDARTRQAMRIRDLDADTAERARAQFDRTHDAYFRQFYGVQIQDPSLYHLVLDSTSIEFDACVEIIALAAASTDDGAEAIRSSANRPAS